MARPDFSDWDNNISIDRRDKQQDLLSFQNQQNRPVPLPLTHPQAGASLYLLPSLWVYSLFRGGGGEDLCKTGQHQNIHCQKEMFSCFREETL